MKRLKFISLILALIMITGCLGALPVFAEEAPTDVPSVQTPEEKYADLYDQGYTYYKEGTIAKGSTAKYILDQDNFEKWYKSQLSAGNDLFGGTYVLATDVVLNEGNAADWKTTKPKNVYKPESNLWGFDGIFDGNDKSISGFCMTPSTASTNNANLGLFGCLVGASEVKNLRVVNSYIESNGDNIYCSVGVFASRLNGPAVKVTNCYTDAIISGNQGFFGGIVGFVTGFKTPQINNCVFAGKIEANGYIGGILGFSDANATVAITNCMNLGELVTSGNQDYVGGIVGLSTFGTNVSEITNCVNLSSNVPNALIGYPGRSLSAIPITDFVMITDIGVSNVAPAAAEINTTNIINKTFVEFFENKVFADWTYEEGCIPNPTTFKLYNFWMEGSKDIQGVTYALNNDNFKAFYSWANGKTLVGNYILVSDITVNEGEASDWENNRAGVTVWTQPIATDITGKFDGQGHSISGVCMVSAANVKTGLFTQVSGTVENVRVLNSYMENTSASGYVESGSVAGRVIGKIKNCYSDAILVNKNTGVYFSVTIGGIAGMSGWADSAIINCVFAGSIEGIGAAGGILGRTNTTVQITDCINLGKVSTIDKYAGGMIGAIEHAITMTNCMNLNPEITSVGTEHGGAEFVGYANLANVLSSNLITLKGFRNANKREISNDATDISSEKTLAELVNITNKIFADWNYEEGYLPNPTTFALDELKVMNFVNADTLGLETQGKIHSIRISPTAPGLRFITFVDADVVDALKALGADVKMKTYITAAKYLQDDKFEFTYEWLNANKKVLATEADGYLYTKAEDGYTAFAGSVANINDLTMEYIARGCLEITMNGKTVLVYADWNESEATCVSRIARLATDDTSTEYTEDYYKNLITDKSGERVYSPYTQAQYNSILLLCAEGTALIPNPANGLTVETAEVEALAFSTNTLDEALSIARDISVQGGCTDGKGYSYNFYVDTDNHTKAWIVKTNLSTGETQVKTLTGGAQNCHCNDVTYNTRTDELLVTAWSNVFVYDPVTLELKSEYTLTGGNIYTIAYNELNNEYYTLKTVNGVDTIVCYDAHFTAYTERVIDWEASAGYQIQGTYTDGVYYYVTESKIGNPDASAWQNKEIANNLQIYDLKTGKLVRCLDMNLEYESENIGFYNGSFYVTCNNGNWSGSKMFTVNVSEA